MSAVVFFGRRLTICFGTINASSTSLDIIILTSLADKINNLHPLRANRLILHSTAGGFVGFTERYVLMLFRLVRVLIVTVYKRKSPLTGEHAMDNHLAQDNE